MGTWTILVFGFAADIDECANETLCGSHGFCENSDGSFRCLCDRGYESSPSGHYCVGESAVSKGEPSLLCDGSQTTDRDCSHALRITHMDRAAHGVKIPSLITADLWDCRL